MRSRSVPLVFVVIVLGLVIAACGVDSSDAEPTSTSTVESSMSSTTTTTSTTTSTTTTMTTTTTLPPPPERVLYRLSVANLWSEETHPGALPSNAHFSHLAGATHEPGAVLWAVGELATPGVTEMAETGRVDTWVGEIEELEGVGEVLSWEWWFCPAATSNSNCGELEVDIEVGIDHPVLTLAAMIGPSPDWFVGVSELVLIDENGWLEELEVDLHPYDAGTHEANRFALGGERTQPPEPIAAITAEDGTLIGPQLIGTYTLTLIGPVVGY